MALTKYGSGKTKVYLSVSKQGDSKAKSIAARYLLAFDFTVYMYDNTTPYDIHDLDIIDLMFVLPPKLEGDGIKNDLKLYTIGKGQHSELTHVMQHAKKKTDFFVISNLVDGLHVDEIRQVNILQSTDWNRWANIHTCDQCINFNNYYKPGGGGGAYDKLCEESYAEYMADNLKRTAMQSQSDLVKQVYYSGGYPQQKNQAAEEARLQANNAEILKELCELKPINPMPDVVWKPRKSTLKLYPALTRRFI